MTGGGDDRDGEATSPMGDFDDTDELPSTSAVFPVPEAHRSDEAGSGAGDPAPTTPLSPGTARDLDGDVAAGRAAGDDTGDPDRAVRVGRAPRFARARRRAVTWDAGWCLVTGVVLLVMAASGRPVGFGPPWTTFLAGAVVVGWAAVLAAVAASGVGRAAAALVGLVNLLVGVAGFLLGWINAEVPTLLLVLAAQVAGFGLVQVVTSVRR